MDRDELVRAACNGDVEARNAIGSWLQGEVERFFAKGRKDREYALELCQGTMVDVWAKSSQLQPETADAFLRLVFGMAWTSILRARSRDARRHERQAKLQLMPQPTPTRSPTTTLVQRELADRYLRELSTPIRETVLWKIEGGTLAEYARARGISEGTARSRYRIGIEQLRKRLTRDGLTPGQCGL